MLSPEDITTGGERDKLFMVSYISQFYTALRDKRPMGGEYIFLSANRCLLCYLKWLTRGSTNMNVNTDYKKRCLTSS